MTKIGVEQIPAKLYELLQSLTPEERSRAVQATFLLFGESAPISLPSSGTPPGKPNLSGSMTPFAFVQTKNPANKGEMLAVAARYRELHENAQTHSKEDLKKVITDARRNFDNTNFARDMKNARRQAGLFNLGTERDASQLSYYGQQYVDALPDKEAASKLKKPKVGGRAKRNAKARSNKG